MVRFSAFAAWVGLLWFGAQGWVVAQATGPATFRVSEFLFSRPAGWQGRRPTSPMRKAEFTVKRNDQVGEVIFYYFGLGGAGGTQANIDRWLGQFREPKDKIDSRIEVGRAGGGRVTYVYAQGTFLSGPPFGTKIPKPGYALLGAIMEGSQGHVFVKFTGPKEVVDAAESDFKAMISSARSK